MKDLLHIYLEPEAHGHDMTFKVCNPGSKQPHLYSAYVVSIASQLHTTVIGQLHEASQSYLCSRNLQPLVDDLHGIVEGGPL